MSVPIGTQIQCSANSQCPGGYSCSSTLEQCIISGSNSDLPGIVDGSVSITPGLACASTSLLVTFDVTLPLGIEPVVSLATKGRQTLTLASASAQHYVFNYQLTGVEGEGVWPILVSLVAKSGASTKDTSLGTVQFDFTAPEVTGATVLLTPDASNPLTRVTALRNGGSAEVSFTTSEPVTIGQINAVCGGALLPLQNASNGGTYFIYELTAAPPTDDTCSISLTMTDRAGNVTTTTLGAATITFDNTPPARGSIDASQVKQLRIPWGATQSSNQEAMYIVPVDLAATEDPLSRSIAPTLTNGDVAAVRVYRTSTEQEPIALLTPTSDGWSARQLALVDSPEIWLAAIDGAGNESTRTRVPKAEWVATMQGKVPASTVANPHVFDTRTFFLDTLVQNLAPLVGSTVALDDGTSEQTNGTGRWIDFDAPTVPASLGFMVFDTRRGKALSVGFTSVDEWDGVHWRTNPVIDPENDGNPLGVGLFVYDQRRGVTVFIGVGSQQAWDYDGVSWRNTCSGAACGVWPPVLAGSPTAYDPDRGIIIGNGNGLWGWDGAQFSVLAAPGPGDATHPIPRGGQSLVYDGNEHATLMFGGSALSGNCEDDGTPNCTDTWSWDGSWHKRATTGPDPRSSAGLAFDGTKTVLFGGNPLASTFCDGTSGYCGRTLVLEDWCLASRTCRG